jgi:beta-aspartyl-peptidase (threonine type)
VSNLKSLILANGEIKDDIIRNGIDLLRRGTSAEDVAEQVARDVEDDADEHTVGFSGLPNVNGAVELDASFMEGATLRAGAVAGIRDFRHPISIARAVMEKLPHVLLVGEGANRFAYEIGAERREMLTPDAHAIWVERLRKLGLSEFDIHRLPSAASDAQPLIELANRAFSLKDGSDTMNVIVRDANAHIVSAVTTSGVAWKFPGRAGDSPVIGAGNYVDDRFGAAACMGLGEIAIRVGAALRAVMSMQMGRSLDQAGADVIQAMRPITADGHWVRVLMMDAQGNCGGVATQGGLFYKIQTVEEDNPRQFEAKT